jgi:hypothetical protein
MIQKVIILNETREAAGNDPDIHILYYLLLAIRYKRLTKDGDCRSAEVIKGFGLCVESS